MIERLALIACLAASPLAALTCGEGKVTLPDDTPWTARMCAVADRAVAALAACNLPLEKAVTVTLTDALEGSCVGLYHCGKGLIEILDPDTLAARTSSSSLFAPLSTESYFDSILTHELAHAAYNGRPCPIGGDCTATAEYLAYAFQIRSLSDEDRAAIGLAEVPGRRIDNAEISAFIAFFSPATFAAKSWTHLMQQDDPCAYVGKVADGMVWFDRPQL